MPETPRKETEELEAKIRVLEEENAYLSERAEETLLLGLVAESVSSIEDPSQIIESVLERISILKRIPYCACYSVSVDSVRLLSSYAAFVDDVTARNTITIPSEIYKELEHGIYTFSCASPEAEGFRIEFQHVDFAPSAIALVPFEASTIPQGIFVFADDSPSDNRLPPMLMLLQQLVDMITGRLDRLFLLAELKRANAELDRRVEERTKELEQANTLLQLEISERGKVEEQLRQSQKMEAVGRLAGGVAHDFNNLLQAIQGYTSFAMEELPRDSAAFADLTEAAIATERATVLVRQLFTLSRREAIQLLQIELSGLIADLVNMLRRIIGEDVDLVVTHGPALARIHADRGQIEQVLMNLCVNARDAMPEGGTITIRSENAVFDDDFRKRNTWASEGEYIQLSAEDSGTGMSDETLEHVFEPFFTTKEVGQGTGLGLATVYGIVNGCIKVESKLGKGTRFRMWFLRDHSHGEAPGAACEEGPGKGGNETILLAEDEEIVRNFARRVLQKAGYKLLVACDGKEAIELFEENAERIDLAVLDVIMPKKSGRAVFDRIKALKPRIPVLFCSGYSFSALEQGSLPPDGYKLLQKPYNRLELLRNIRILLQRPK